MTRDSWRSFVWAYVALVIFLGFLLNTSRINTTWGSLARPSDRKVHLLIPINKDKHSVYTCRSMMTSIIHGYEPTIINWESQKSNYTLLKMEKINAVADYVENGLKDASEKDLVFMIDAMDVWLQASPQYLISRYEELGAGVIIGADRMCWPNEGDSPECTEAEESPVPEGIFDEMVDGTRIMKQPRYANSGTIVGDLKSIRTLYKDLQKIYEERQDTTTDQGIFNELLLRNKKLVKVDYLLRMFWPSAYNSEAVSMVHVPTPELFDTPIPGSKKTAMGRPDLSSQYDPPWRLYPRLLLHRLTGQFPLAIHINDSRNKVQLNKLWQADGSALWFSSMNGRFREIVEKRLEGKMLKMAHDGSEIRYDSICPADLSPPAGDPQ